MEPISANHGNEACDLKEKKSQGSGERVSLGPRQCEIVNAWIGQIDEWTNGAIKLSKAELINFLLGQQPASLSTKQLQIIRKQFYDPVRHISSITPRLKLALASSDQVAISALQNELRTVGSILADTKGVSEAVSSRRQSRSGANKLSRIKRNSAAGERESRGSSDLSTAEDSVSR